MCAVFALVKSLGLGALCGFCRIPKCATVSWVQVLRTSVLFMCFIVCFWWQIFPCHFVNKDEKRDEELLLCSCYHRLVLTLSLFLPLFFISFIICRAFSIVFLFYLLFWIFASRATAILFVHSLFRRNFLIPQFVVVFGFFPAVSFSTTNNNNYEEVVCLYDLCVCVKILWNSATRYDDR